MPKICKVYNIRGRTFVLTLVIKSWRRKLKLNYFFLFSFPCHPSGPLEMKDTFNSVSLSKLDKQINDMNLHGPLCLQLAPLAKINKLTSNIHTHLGFRVPHIGLTWGLSVLWPCFSLFFKIYVLFLLNLKDLLLILSMVLCGSSEAFGSCA